MPVCAGWHVRVRVCVLCLGQSVQLTFLGTASQAPSLTRNVSSHALKFSGTGAVWLFDVGEATQVGPVAARQRAASVEIQISATLALTFLPFV